MLYNHAFLGFSWLSRIGLVSFFEKSALPPNVTSVILLSVMKTICAIYADSATTPLEPNLPADMWGEILAYLTRCPIARIALARTSRWFANRIGRVKILYPYAVFSCAASEGALWAAQRTVANGYTHKDSYLYGEAAKRGDIPMLTWWVSLSPPGHVGKIQAMYAAEANQLETLELVMDHSLIDHSYAAALEAAAAGHLEILMYLDDFECELDEWMVAEAAGGGHIHILDYICTKFPSTNWDTKPTTRAAARGQFEAMQWLLCQDPPCPFDYNDCLYDTASPGEYYYNEALRDWLLNMSPSEIDRLEAT